MVLSSLCLVSHYPFTTKHTCSQVGPNGKTGRFKHMHFFSHQTVTPETATNKFSKNS